MAGNIVNFVADGRTGANIETQLQNYGNALRGAIREWDTGFDGTLCHMDGIVYALADGGDQTVDPSLATGDWTPFDANVVDHGTYAEFLATDLPFFVVEGETDESLNGHYVNYDGSYVKVWPIETSVVSDGTKVDQSVYDAQVTAFEDIHTALAAGIDNKVSLPSSPIVVSGDLSTDAGKQSALSAVISALASLSIIDNQTT